MKPVRVAAHALRAHGTSVLAFLVLATSSVALGGVAPGAGATGEEPYSLQAEALFSPAATDLTLRVDGPTVPSVLEKVQVKAWPADGGGAQTRNFFDVASPGGVDDPARWSGTRRTARVASPSRCPAATQSRRGHDRRATAGPDRDASRRSRRHRPDTRLQHDRDGRGGGRGRRRRGRRAAL